MSSHQPGHITDRLGKFAMRTIAGTILLMAAVVLAAKGVGKIAGTRSYNHVGVYAKLLPSNQLCLAASPRLRAISLSHEGERVVLRVEPSGALKPEYQTRVNGGFWSTWRVAGFDGALEVTHPRLMLRAEHRIEVRVRDALKPDALSDPVGVAIAP